MRFTNALRCSRTPLRMRQNRFKMPKNPVCVQCDSTQSLLWRSIEGGKLCHECHLMDGGAGPAAEPEDVRDEPEDAKEKPDEQSPAPARSTKKGGNRWTRARTGAAAAASAAAAATSTPNPPKSAPARGRGRRSLFKRTPLKAPTATATIVTSDTVFHNVLSQRIIPFRRFVLIVITYRSFQGMYMQVGDIVSMIDEEEDIYYAQIRGFVTDQYCEKSAVITWLLPTKASPPPNRGFDPPTYIIGNSTLQHYLLHI